MSSVESMPLFNSAVAESAEVVTLTIPRWTLAILLGDVLSLHVTCETEEETQRLAALQELALIAISMAIETEGYFTEGGEESKPAFIAGIIQHALDQDEANEREGT